MSTFGQIFPSSPKFTEQNLPDLSGKVYIVTGAASGVGYELAKILYQRHGTVYIATRSTAKIDNAIQSIRRDVITSHGRLQPLVLDLSDLSSIKPAAQKFLSQEERLDVLIHNAGVMTPPAGSKTKTGHDLEMGTNCLGPFLLNRFMQPILQKTAKLTPRPSDVRVVWVASMINVGTEKGGIVWDSKTGQPKVLSDAMKNYMESKVGDVFLAHESAKRLGQDGILCMSVHPGLMRTELQRHANPMVRTVMGAVFKPPRFGAYTELFAGFSPDVTPEHNGGFIIPWGRHGSIPANIAEGMKSKAQGGTGLSERFWAWCDQETRPYQSRVEPIAGA